MWRVAAWPKRPLDILALGRTQNGRYHRRPAESCPSATGPKSAGWALALVQTIQIFKRNGFWNLTAGPQLLSHGFSF